MPKTISIIGIGALGKALARALHRQGYHITGVYNRTEGEAEVLGAELEVDTTGVFPSSVNEIGKILFVTVSDGAITEIADKLAALSGDFSDTIVAHCSGAETSRLLAPVQKAGAQTAAFHPLQTFNKESDPQVFNDIYVSLEGEEQAVEGLESLVEDLSAYPLRVTPASKAYLHASAVMASNYLFALAKLAGDIAELGDIDHHKARKALLPLVLTTAQNSAAPELSEVLSGPLARGDVDTIKKHLGLLEQNEQLTALYKQLGLITLELADTDGKFNEEIRRQLHQLLALD